MPTLTIRLKRHTDGSASLTCTRADGSVTWQRQKPSVAVFFPQHDLTHYAVESTLGYRRGFFGLLADGWEISDFAAPWPRGIIPVEAREVEVLVGLFDGMRRGRVPWTSDEFNAQAKEIAADTTRYHGMTPPTLSDADIAQITILRDELLTQWLAVAAGDAMHLNYEL